MSELTKERPTTLLDTPPVQFTQGAINELKTLLYEKDVPDTHQLRVGVKGGGCSGMSYILGFDLKKDGDMEFEVDGIPIILNKTHTMYLIGMEVDYVNGLNNRGFVFNNPNAESTCGCGSSFSA
ncbi:MAG: iron-sulfur cluster assembly accessory protein [Chitinophagales bacterium]